MPSDAATGSHDALDAVLERNQEAIRAAKVEEDRLERSVRRSDAAAERIKRVLRKAGLLAGH